MNRFEKCCNMCGKKISERGLQQEDSLVIDKKWGYFSDKDGERHRIVLCETCYDALIKQFIIPPDVEEITEMAY